MSQTINQLLQGLHQSKNIAELETNADLVSAYVDIPEWATEKAIRELYLKNYLFGSDVSIGGGGSGNSLFEISSGSLQPSTNTSAAGLFDIDGNGDFQPITSGGSDDYFERDGNGDIEPI